MYLNLPRENSKLNIQKFGIDKTMEIGTIHINYDITNSLKVVGQTQLLFGLYLEVKNANEQLGLSVHAF